MFEKEWKKYSSQNCKIKDISQTTLKFCYTALFSLLLYPSFWLKQWWNQYLHVSRNQGDPSPLLRDFWEEKAFTLAWLVSFWSLRWAGWASQGRHVRSCFPFTKELKLPKCFPSIKNPHRMLIMDIIDCSVSGDSWKAMFAKHDVSQPRVTETIHFLDLNVMLNPVSYVCDFPDWTGIHKLKCFC